MKMDTKVVFPLRITKTKTTEAYSKNSSSLLFPHEPLLLIYFKNLCSRRTKLKNLVLLRRNVGFLPSADHIVFQSSTSQWCLKASSTVWQSCIKIYLEKSQFWTLALNLMPPFASATGRYYEIHFIVLNKYLKYIIHCLQFFCVMQKLGSVRGEVCLKRISDQITSFGVGHSQLLVFLWRSAAEYSPLCVCTSSQSKSSLKKCP